ncbi:MAG: PDZ domain-containing protein [Planctomycetota bacterium]|nr:PDZ domain-containing protein [Planctomycetota bacterium]
MIFRNRNTVGFSVFGGFIVWALLPAIGHCQESTIDQLIEQLGSRSYEDRNLATKKLVEAGKPAIGPLFSAISSKQFETSFRALRIVKRIGIQGELDTLELIILESGKLPAAFQEMFEAWSLEALDGWRAKQSETAAEALLANGVEVTQIEGLSELGLLLIEDADFQLQKTRVVPTSQATVLQQIADLKKELAGEAIDSGGQDDEKLDREDNRVERSNQVEFQIQGRPKLAPRNGPVRIFNGNQLKATNVVFGSGWKGQVTDLLHLRFLNHLNEVEFVELEITREMLEQLDRIRNLRSIKLTRCQYSFSQLRQFKQIREKKLPLRLVATGVGYLGVYGPNLSEPDNGTGSYVSMVSPNSAASEAGLERGDIIVKVDDERIVSFAELSLVISSKAVGKAIELTVKRRGEEKTLRAVLKSRVGLR